jgi:hypothetical protein
MHIARKHLPSPLMGEGSGGGGSRAASPHPNLPRSRGEGLVTYSGQPTKGEKECG